ncbi:MAG: inositol oxygenase [Planctomycetes bacterium]|nr:inositol oxygenase [Planctomycetota bacterium]
MDDARPLGSLDEWEEDLLRRYPEPSGAVAAKPGAAFRDYAAGARASVRRFYELNHRHQTVDFVRAKRGEYLGRGKMRMGIWEAMEYLNQLVDDSDPDLDLPQIEHLLQTAEAVRATGRPDWYVLAGLVHDLGKILCIWGEPQWAVVGDTFPVGCRFSEAIVFPEFFAANPDSARPEYQTELGIYSEGCGLDAVLLSWGHDEYLYHVVKPYLPTPALAMIRWHSCYPIHREGAYARFLTDGDRALLRWVRDFNQFDLYTKRDQRMDVAALRPYYEDLIGRYFPPSLAW